MHELSSTSRCEPQKWFAKKPINIEVVMFEHGLETRGQDMYAALHTSATRSDSMAPSRPASHPLRHSSKSK